MGRIVAGLVSGAVVALAASAWGAGAAGDDGPALTAPTVTGPVAEPPGEIPKPIEATPIPAAGPVLVVPGMDTRRGGSRTRSRTTASIPPPSPPRADDGLPALVGPAEMREPAPAPAPAARRPRNPVRMVEPGGPIGRPPLTLESVPAEEIKEGSLAPEPHGRRDPAESRGTSPPPPRRPGGLFGRFLPPPAAGDRDRRDVRDLVKVEPRTDPAADAALKRNVEKQISESLGTRLRSYEVRVVGREVTIHARASRFWQRRAVKNSLESLPAIQGYKARVEVSD